MTSCQQEKLFLSRPATWCYLSYVALIQEVTIKKCWLFITMNEPFIHKWLYMDYVYPINSVSLRKLLGCYYVTLQYRDINQQCHVLNACHDCYVTILTSYTLCLRLEGWNFPRKGRENFPLDALISSKG